MTLRRYAAALLLAALTVSSAATAQTTRKLSATKANDYGVAYSLPLTGLSITIEAERTVSTPGEFYKYALPMLGSTDAVACKSEQWRLLSVTLNAQPVAQPIDGQSYLIQLKSGTATPFVVVSDQGFPLAINTDEVMTVTPPTLPTARAAEPTALEGAAARQAVTEDMVRSSSSAKKAELAAARIMEIRQSRNDYLTGQADQMPDGAALKLILQNLDAQEAALTAMFVGTVQTSTEVRTYTFTPTADDAVSEVIARLSPTAGLVDADDLSGAPIYLNVTATSRGQLPLTEKGEERKFPAGGVAYTIPGQANVEVKFSGKVYARQSVDLAQLGVVYGVDPALFTDKKAPAQMIFNPITGGIYTLGHE